MPSLEKIELTGNSIYEYIHPSDHDEMYEVLNFFPSPIPAQSPMSQGNNFNCAQISIKIA